MGQDRDGASGTDARPTGASSPNEVRFDVARAIVARRQKTLGAALVAAACYGSVAHGAAMSHSDVELVVVTDDSLEPEEEKFFERGIMVECDRLPAARMLAAARRIRWTWGLEADQHEHHRVIWDPDGFFPRLWEVAAEARRTGDFGPAERRGWWVAAELRDKLRNAVLADDRPRAVCLGWEIARAIAMRIALRERVPYESGRTLWADVAARGHGMPALIAALTSGDVPAIARGVEEIWERTRAWGVPDEMLDESEAS
jgi:predicted nucleotidyltransferase